MRGEEGGGRGASSPRRARRQLLLSFSLARGFPRGAMAVEATTAWRARWRGSMASVGTARRVQGRRAEHRGLLASRRDLHGVKLPSPALLASWRGGSETGTHPSPPRLRARRGRAPFPGGRGGGGHGGSSLPSGRSAAAATGGTRRSTAMGVRTERRGCVGGPVLLLRPSPAPLLRSWPATRPCLPAASMAGVLASTARAGWRLPLPPAAEPPRWSLQRPPLPLRRRPWRPRSERA